MFLFRVILILCAAVVYAPLFIGLAHAQTIEVPNTAAELWPWLLAFLSSTGFAAWMGTVLTSALKNVTKKWPIFGTAKDVALISGLTSKLVVAILVAATGQIAVAFTPVADYLDQSGLWGVVVAAVLVATKLYQSEKSTDVQKLIIKEKLY